MLSCIGDTGGTWVPLALNHAQPVVVKMGLALSSTGSTFTCMLAMITEGSYKNRKLAGMPQLPTAKPLTSTGISKFRPSQEAKVPSPGPDGLAVPKAQPGTEVVSMKCLLPIDSVVPSGIVGTAHPDLGDQKAGEGHMTHGE